MTQDAEAIRARAAAVVQAGIELRAAGTKERARWLLEATSNLARRAADACDTLSEATGLSAPMVRWATRTTLDTISEEPLLALAAQASEESSRPVEPIAMLSLVLAGNVFTASVRGILVPLLLGVPVFAKASSKEVLFPAMLLEAIRESDARLGASLDLLTFVGGDAALESAFVEQAEAVSVYGSDDTIAAMTLRLGAKPFIAHGHGVSVAYCDAQALDAGAVDETIERLALDISAYDQRGCLSPQLVYVEETRQMTALSFARRLCEEGLDPMELSLPRGTLPIATGAVQAQWRGVAEVEGDLLRGDTYSVAVRPSHPIRWSPGYRNLTLSPVRGIDDALRAMEPIGSNLKCVGASVNSASSIRNRLAESLTLDAYVCALGEMQIPALDAPADGRPIWHGLFRS
jgi:hypothetical protein